MFTRGSLGKVESSQVAYGKTKTQTLYPIGYCPQPRSSPKAERKGLPCPAKFTIISIIHSPLDSSASIDFLSSRSVSLPVDPKAKKILVVDDEEPMRKFLESCLNNHGFDELAFCINGSQLCDTVTREQPHLIILDVMMPRGNGLRALRSLKTNPATEKIPVIVMSGYNIEVLEQCAPEHVNVFLPKPFSAPDIMMHVNQFLDT